MDDPHTPDAVADGARDDELLRRLRAADPAAGTAPDLDRVHARLTAATGVPLGAASDDSAGSTSDDVTGDAVTGATEVDELAVARARRTRRTRWLQVAAVVGAIAVAGGGGYAAGAGGGASSTGTTAAAPIVLPGAQGLESADQAVGSESAGTRMLTYPAFGGRTVFSGAGLDGSGTSAHAWAFDAEAVVSEETAAHLAEVFGVAGEPRQEWGQWVVGPSDGTGATVTLGVDGQASVGFYDQAWDPSSCTASAPDTPDTSTDEAGEGAVEAPMPVLPGGTADPADPSVCDPSTTPTGGAAVERTRTLLTDLGVDADGYEYQVLEDTGVDGLVQVEAAQVVDGTQTGVVWSVSLAGTGIQSAWGALAPLVDLGEYGVVSPAEAVDRLNDPRFGATYGNVVPLAARGLAEDASVGVLTDEPTEGATVPATPEPGAAVAWPVSAVTLVDARLGVSVLTLPDGAAVLVPAWELTDADGTAWSVVAVVEDQLDLSPVG